MHVYEEGCGSTHSCLSISVDALLAAAASCETRGKGTYGSSIITIQPQLTIRRRLPQRKTVCVILFFGTISKHVLPPTIDKPNGFSPQGIHR